MKVYGITGGVGCGKSTVLKLLKDNFNSYIIMADDVAKELMNPGKEGYKKVVDFFGEDILKADKTINREELAKIIFNNSNKRIVLNSIIHPLVKSSIINEITTQKIKQQYDYIFVEAALLLEDHYDNFCDEVWYIKTSEENRRKRLKSSRGYSDEKIDSMIKSQMGEKEFEQKCDRIINNDKTVEETSSELELLLNK